MTQSNNRNFFIRRFHSLIALIPIGIFVFVHLMINASVFMGGFEGYNTFVTVMKSESLKLYITAAEIIIIALPLIFHGIYGLYIVYKAKNNALDYKYYRNWAFYLQRITAIIIVIFLVFHVFFLRLNGHETSEDVIYTLVAILQNPLYLVLYIIGVVASIYHLTNGLFTFCITWGICQGEKAQRIFSICAILLFFAVSIFAVAILIKIMMIPLPAGF